MPISNDATLRAFIERLLGWSDERTVELAARSLALVLGHRATLALCGEGDMAPIAQALHRRALGTSRPFVVCDPSRVQRSSCRRRFFTSDRGPRPAPVGSVTRAL